MSKLSLEERAEYIVDSIEESEETQEEDILFKDPVKQLGFAAIDHAITLDGKISDGAYRTYALLLLYAQQKDKMWTGVRNLAIARDKNVATIKRHLKELTNAGMITRQRRMNSSSVTYIENSPEHQVELAKTILTDRFNKKKSRRAQKCAHEERKNEPREEEQVEEEQVNILAQVDNSDDLFADVDKPVEREPHDYKKGIANALSEYERNAGLNAGVADSYVGKKQWVEQVSQWFADCLERPRVSFDKEEAKRAYEELKLGDKANTELILEYCTLVKGTFKAQNGKEPNARWIMNGFEQWKVKPKPTVTRRGRNLGI